MHRIETLGHERERKRLLDLVMSAPAIVCVLRGPEHVFELANTLYLQLIGRPASAVIRRPVRAVLPEVEGQGYFEILDRVYATGEPFVGSESPVKLRSRTTGELEESFVNFVYQPTRDLAGAIDGVFVHAVDVTQQVLARRQVEELAARVGIERDRARASEEQLRKNQETFFRLIENAPFGVYVVDAQFKLRQVSAGSRKVFHGIDPLLGRDFAEILRVVWEEPFATEAINRFRHTLATGEPYSARNTTEQRGNVEEIESYDWRIERVTLPDGSFGVVCYFYDITERKQAEEALRASERETKLARDYAEATLRTSPLPLLVLEKDLRVASANDAFYHAFRVDPAATEGRLIFELGNGQWKIPKLRELLEDILPGKTVIKSFEVAHDFESIGRRIMLLNARRMENEAGTPERIVLVVEDITERKRAEEALRTSEARLRLFIDHAPAALAMFDREMRYVAASQRWKDDYRLSGDLVGRSHYEIFPDVPARWKEVHQRGLAGEVLRSEDDPFLRADGTLQFIQWEVRPWLAAAGEVGGILIAAEDVTQRNQATNALRESEARQTFLLELGDALRVLADPDQIQVTATRVLGKRLGADRVAYFEVDGADYVVRRDYTNGVRGLAGSYPVAAFGEHLPALYRRGQTVLSRDVVNDPALPPSDRAAHLAIEIAAFVGVPLIKDGKFVGGLTAHMREPRNWTDAEISLIEETAERTWAAVERARAEEALRRARERFDIVKDSTQVGFWFCDLPFDKLEWDNRVKEHFWLPSDADVTIDTFYAQIHPEDRQPTRFAIEASIANKTHYETEYRTVSPDATAQVKWIRAIGRGFYDEKGQPIRFDGVTLDITQRKRAEEALRASEERMNLAAQTAGFGVHDFDLEDGQIFWSPELYAIAGVAPGTVITMEMVVSTFHPEDRERVERAMQAALSPTGTGEFAEEFRVRRVDDGRTRWFFNRSQTLFAGSGGDRKAVRNTGVVVDVTDRKQAEQALRDAHSLLADKASHLETLVQQRTAKLRETIGELEAFSYSIAHDMRAPLRSLQGFSDALLSDYADKVDAEGQSYLRRIAKSAARMDKLIQDVLSYSRVVRGEWPFEAVDVEQLLRGIADTYPMLAPEKAEISLEGEFPRVLGSEAMLMQIFSNLLGNAVKFVPAGTRPQIRVWAETRGERVRLFVRDNGIGIAPEQHEKIFGIFQQGGTGYEGTGIGLAVVKKAAERMNGKVGVESELGHGATFWVEIQRA